ncbi:MAG: hypothetical protein AAB870_00985, partial [Patescibacteria group bacterium]
NPTPNTVNGQRKVDKGEMIYESAAVQHQNFYIAVQMKLFQDKITCTIIDGDPNHPDNVFPEDTGVHFIGIDPQTKEYIYIWVCASLAHPTRKGEENIFEKHATATLQHLKCFTLEKGTLEGGDIIVADSCIYAGKSARTNDDGIDSLEKISTHYGIPVVRIDVPDDVLHLKGIGSFHHGNGTTIQPFVMVSERIADQFQNAGHHHLVITSQSEDSFFGANAISHENRILIHQGANIEPQLLVLGMDVHVIDLSEFRKIDGAMSCLWKYLSYTE